MSRVMNALHIFMSNQHVQASMKKIAKEKRFQKFFCSDWLIFTHNFMKQLINEVGYLERIEM